MKTLFNKYGVLDHDSPTEKLMNEIGRTWQNHCQELMAQGITPTEIRALDSLAMSAISCGTSAAILRRAMQMRSEKRKLLHHQLEDYLDNEAEKAEKANQPIFVHHKSRE